MLKFIIADDNELSRRALIESIPWGNYHCEFAGEADNGTDALALIRDKKPELAFLDIKMPGMSGLEIVEALGTDETLFILVSAYDDYELLRRSLKAGVFDYVLKPVSDAELLGVLEKAIQKIGERNSSEYVKKEPLLEMEAYRKELEEKLLGDALNQSMEGAEKLEAFYKKAMHIHDYALLVVTPENHQEAYGTDAFLEEQRSILEEIGHTYEADVRGTPREDGYAFFFSFRKMLPVKEYNLTMLRIARFIYERNLENGIQSYITISRIYQNVRDIGEAYRDNRFCKRNRFFQENQAIVHYDSLHSKSIRNEYGKMKKLDELYDMCREQPERIVDGMEAFLSEFSENETYDISYVKNILIQAALMISYIVRKNHPEAEEIKTPDEIASFLTSCDSIYAAFAWMREYAHAMEKLHEKTYGGGVQVRRIIDFLNLRYMEDISLGDAASALGISGTHITRLLKQETGETFVTMLNKIRIRESIRLLKTGDYKVYEVAEMVGYSNYAYFYQIFKKATGTSPRDYV